MLVLRKVLLSNKLYYFILTVTLLITSVRIIIPKESHYNENTKEVIGTITSLRKTPAKLDIEIKAKEKLKATIYLKNKQIPNLKLGDKIKVTGKFYLPKKNTTKNLFNYRDYLKHKNIFYLIKISNIKIISKNKNIYYHLKQKLINNLEINPYLLTFILGDKSKLKKEVTTSYQENGISHLFAISGMHITLLVNIITKLLKKTNLQEETLFKITSVILFIYLLLVGFSPSILRGVLFYYLFTINKIYYFNIKTLNLFILILSLSLLINPNYLFDIGFQYSYLISFSLLYFQDKLKSNNYLQGLLKVSLLSFLVSFPITLNSFNQINILSIFYNLIFVPLVSLVIFPLALLTAFLKPLLPIFNFLIAILESLSLLFNNLNFSKFIFKNIPKLFYLIYLLLIFLILKTSQKKYLIIFLLILIIHYLLPSLNQNTFIRIIDVGQGDTILLTIKNKSVLIDTGGSQMHTGNIYNNTLKPTFKTLGIKKLNYLILSHGDKDHLGEAKPLLEDFKVEKVIFNCGEFNDLEQELIKVLEKKKIKYYSCIKELNVDNNKLYFLQTKEYDNENDNSNVIYTELNGYKFLFMGDAGIEKEKDILNKYNISDIDVLKVGHHGSKTSSCKDFINEVNPKYGVISVGKSNRYGHPNKEVLDTIESSKIYRTDQDGSIMFKIKNNKLKIENCSP